MCYISETVFGMVVALICASPAAADTIHFQDGRQIEGVVQNETDESVEVDVGFGVVRYSKDRVARIAYSDDQDHEAFLQDWLPSKEEPSNEPKESRPIDSLPRIVPVQMDGQQVFVDTVLNGNVHARLLMDTGASIVLLSQAVVKKLGIPYDKVGRTMRVQVADGRVVDAVAIRLEKVRVGNAEADWVDAAVLIQEEGGLRFEDGLLGMSFLGRFDFRVDSGESKLILKER